ncbi:hypothetical protein B0S90_2830 [Caldicellulosiruptor bescii]|uniref:Uncharacterized protein n=1 Tax=Caldicellulosiruptor bescii TaxID=31899 RepID=A0ABY1S5X0_CALBS|nr:hypothetical protein B0S87_1661 [Caldicellulosiruptor bescii]PBC91886.1 hypothetical protein B0S89_2332 [Caldicellulosiruptor bescii]PBD02703.1 hypothetical protein B0S85_0242 [Caldicellulosiruptor bescii]PBD07680.1 hypothetical protein B0S90_2830 [Caldicellulosiruptor bescii]PBD10244.1 hypothetical protein B0S84_2746 [Caldicellulosiruptor bescii]
MSRQTVEELFENLFENLFCDLESGLYDFKT